MGFPSLDCLVWGEHTGSLMLHTDQKTLIKTASQAALEGKGLEGRLSVGGSSPRPLPNPTVPRVYCGEACCCFSTLTSFLQL